MEPTGLRDVFKCITLSIAAMEDIVLLPKPTNDPPVHRPTVTETIGLHHITPEHLQLTVVNRKSDEHKDGLAKKMSHSVMMSQPKMIPNFPSQNAAPLGAADTTLHNTAAKNGGTQLNKAGAGRKTSIAKISDPSIWKQNKQKQLRMEGKAYVSKRKKDGEIVTKQPRAVGPRCTSIACRRASNRLCNDINEEARKKVFEDFWQHMDWAQRKLYVAGQVDRDPVERSRAVGSQSRRSVSLRYHLMVDGKRKQVCKNMFLSTLGIGEWSVLNWAQIGATKKNEENENKKLEKKPAVSRRHQPNPASSSAVCNTVEVTQEQVNTTDRNKNLPQEPEGSSRNKSRVPEPLAWKQNRQKQLRMEGKPYVSKRKKDGTTITKAQRTIGARCTSGACRKASNRFCAEFSEEARAELFTNFWQGMNWAQRKTYVSGLVDCDPIERSRAPWTQSRRSVSMRYNLLVAGGDRRQVCKNMFLSTLGVGEWSVLNWAQNTSEQDEENAEKQTQRRSRKASEHVVLKEFLKGLPKVPSYCRGTTSMAKQYLEPVFSNMSEVYRHYYNHCSERRSPPLSRQVFCAVFKRMDLGLCDPKKDQGCGLGVTTGNLFNELWEEYCMERGAPGPEKSGKQ